MLSFRFKQCAVEDCYSRLFTDSRGKGMTPVDQFISIDLNPCAILKVR